MNKSTQRVQKSKLGYIITAIVFLIIGIFTGFRLAPYMPEIEKHIQVSFQSLVTHFNQDKSKKVLVVLPLTGPAASWGEHFKRGVDMFGRTHPDRHIDIQVIDSQGNPANAISAVQQASLSRKPYAIVSTLSSITVPLKEWTQPEHIFLVASVITDKILQNPTLVQRVYPSVANNAGPLAKYAKSKYNRVAILYSNEELGLAVRRTFEQKYLGDNRTIALADGYALKETEVRTLVMKFIQVRPDAILVTGIGPAFWAIIRELKAQAYTGQILSDASFADPVQIDKLGEAAEKIIFVGSETELTEPRTEAAKNFNIEFEKAFGMPVNYTGVTVYESLSMLEKLSVTTNELTNVSFPSLGDWVGIPGTIRFLQGGDCDYPWFLIQRVNGKNVPISE